MIPPVGLNQDTVDLFEVHGFSLFLDGFEQAGDRKISGFAKEAASGVVFGHRTFADGESEKLLCKRNEA